MRGVTQWGWGEKPHPPTEKGGCPVSTRKPFAGCFVESTSGHSGCSHSRLNTDLGCIVYLFVCLCLRQSYSVQTLNDLELTVRTD